MYKKDNLNKFNLNSFLRIHMNVTYILRIL